MAETIEEAFRILPEQGSSDSLHCETEPRPARLGISRIWVHPEHRRHHYASKLLDAARASFSYGYTFPKEVCAVTQPTPKGHAFFRIYWENPAYLVYS